MRTHRPSIRLMMMVIVILALNFALFLNFPPFRNANVAAMFGPIGLAVQLGIIRALRGPRECRPFWVSFVAAGVIIAPGTVLLGFARPRPIVGLWTAYLQLLNTQFGRLPRFGSSHPGHETLHFAVVASFFFPAQIFLASLAGVLGANLSQWRKVRSHKINRPTRKLRRP